MIEKKVNDSSWEGDVKEQSKKPSRRGREGGEQQESQKPESARGAQAPGRVGRRGARSGYSALESNRLPGFNVILVRFDGLALGTEPVKKSTNAPAAAKAPQEHQQADSIPCPAGPKHKKPVADNWSALSEKGTMCG